MNLHRLPIEIFRGFNKNILNMWIVGIYVLLTGINSGNYEFFVCSLHKFPKCIYLLQ